MFGADEKDAIVSDVRDWVAARGLNAGREGCWTAFIDRVRDNLHIVLAMSPVGDAFRARWVAEAGAQRASVRGCRVHGGKFWSGAQCWLIFGVRFGRTSRESRL
jgi:hypothetical protein